jgi:hypothetical protein
MRQPALFLSGSTIKRPIKAVSLHFAQNSSLYILAISTISKEPTSFHTMIQQPLSTDESTHSISSVNHRDSRSTRSSIKNENLLAEQALSLQRASVALDAAQVGTMTRWNEHVVETVAEESLEENDNWTLKSGLHAQVRRSAMFQCVNEAAAIGQMKGGELEVIVTNYADVDESSVEYQAAEEEQPIRRSVRRASQLVDRFVLDQAIKKTNLWSAEHAIEQMEDYKNARESWAVGNANNNVPLAASIIPRFELQVCYMTQKRLRYCVSMEAADQGYSRFDRLQKSQKLRVRTKCACVYCIHPTSFQTQSYQRLRMRQSWTDDSLEGERDEEAKGSKAQNVVTLSAYPVLPASRSCPKVHHPTTTSFRIPSWAIPMSSRSVKHPKSKASTQSSPIVPSNASPEWVSPRAMRRNMATSLNGSGELLPCMPEFNHNPSPDWTSPKLRKRSAISVEKKMSSLRHEAQVPEWAAAGFKITPKQSKRKSITPSSLSPKMTMLDEEIDEEELLRRELEASLRWDESNLPQVPSIWLS